MAATGHGVSWNALLHAGFAVLVAAGCGGNPPAADGPEPEPEQVEVGYGTQDPRRVTGAVGSLNTEDRNANRATRVEELFQGRLAGVQVTNTGSGYSVRVRGAGSLLSGGEPLYVVDGVPLYAAAPGHALDGINPSDVARIDVLKDAGAAAIYGSKAANGVILITTRRQ